MISDLSPTVVKEWYNLFIKMENPPPNIEYAVFDVCDIPFTDGSLEVVSRSAAIINIEGNRDLALKEIYRVLQPSGLFVPLTLLGNSWVLEFTDTEGNDIEVWQPANVEKSSN